MNSILTEWGENEYREFLKEESWKEGHESGKCEEIREGIFFNGRGGKTLHC